MTNEQFEKDFLSPELRAHVDLFTDGGFVIIMHIADDDAHSVVTGDVSAARLKHAHKTFNNTVESVLRIRPDLLLAALKDIALNANVKEPAHA